MTGLVTFCGSSQGVASVAHHAHALLHGLRSGIILVSMNAFECSASAGKAVDAFAPVLQNAKAIANFPSSHITLPMVTGWLH